MKRKGKVLPRAKDGLLALALTVFSGTAYSQTTYTFNYTGSTQTITLPAGNFSFQCWGADGGNATNGSYPMSGGKGGFSTGMYSNSVTAVFNVYVGGHGGNASGASNLGGGGGGMSDIAPASNPTLVIIAAGGGGGATSGISSESSTGGGGGGLVGGGAIDGTGVSTGTAATGGSQTAGGFAVGGSYGAGSPGGYGYGGGAANGGTAGVMHGAGGAGGNGGTGGWNGGGGGCTATGGNDHSAGGGAGYYGGGGGRGDGGAGGGGSSYIGGVTSATTIMFGQSGFVANPDLTGHGHIRIIELCNISLTAAGASSSLAPQICAGQSLTLTTDAVTNYSWSTGQITNSIVVAPNTNTVYSVTGTSSANCTTTRTISVTVSAGIPTLAISNPSPNVCLGTTVTLTASGAFTYTWTNGVVNGQPFVPTSNAVYTVTGGNPCGTSTAVTSVSVAPLSVNVAASSTNICDGTPTNLTATSTATGYTWTPGNITGASVIVSPSAYTSYTVSASDGTCSGTATIDIQVRPTPTITVVATLTNICQGDQTTLTANGGLSYTWSPGSMTTNVVAVTPATSTVYVVSGTNSVACVSSTQQVVVVKPAPNVVATANQTLVCSGSTLELNASGASSYVWTNGPPSNTYVVSPTGPAVYTVTGTGSNGCTKAATIMVSAIVPSVTVPASVAVCAGSAASITASGATSYSWNGMNWGGGFYSFTPGANTIVVLTSSTDQNNLQCLLSQTINVFVDPNPTITITGPKLTICAKESATLTADGAISYSWGQFGTSASIVVTPVNTTTYAVTGTDAKGCQGSNSVTVKVNPCTGIDEQTTSMFSVYPNPNSGSFIISSTVEMDGVIYDNTGRTVSYFHTNVSENNKVDITGLPAGVYFVTASNGGRAYSKRIVILK